MSALVAARQLVFRSAAVSYFESKLLQITTQSLALVNFRQLQLSPSIMSWKEKKDYFLNMPQSEKRTQHKNLVPLHSVPTWSEFYAKNKDAIKTPDEAEATHSEQLNLRVSVWLGDITRLEVDAVVNAANSRLRGGAGVDGAIHAAAGKYLLEECITLNGCCVGEAKLTGGYSLPAKYVIQTVGPQGEIPEKLAACYTSSLQLAVKNNIRTVAFPCISTGVYGYPQCKAARVAISTVRNFLESEGLDKIDRVVFCVFLGEDLEHYKSIMPQYFP